jgi:hypothetical protein
MDNICRVGPLAWCQFSEWSFLLVWNPQTPVLFAMLDTSTSVAPTFSLIMHV